MRTAGSLNLTDDFTVLNSSGLPGETIAQLIDAIQDEEHVIYIECGTFTAGMIQLNLERDGN